MSYKLLTSRMPRLNSVTFTRYQTVRQYASEPKKEPEVSVNTLKGAVYDKKPVKVLLKEGKVYKWCLCGRSFKQPFCNGRHNLENIIRKITMKPGVFKPIDFTVPETKEYWLCNCKQTSKGPFCDGTHKNLP